ncbi:M81 family peptidase [Roseovarius faecimaris]|uniref:Microcystinase C n=1 Tax=Roseovarius faecimaris TaxID=2494550 RepID=A0A6I6IMR0_9RHOB|nr:M81 family metallopeptidase [Roseovarius faecimaris]QGX97582.1 M81 family peptidase [Roseovarius faecimaris]
MRILVAGFQHETNTFGATRAGLPEFEMADSWPGMLRGAQVHDGLRGANLPLAGFLAAAEGQAEIVPVVWCAAEPSAHVTDEAYETITGMILDALRRERGLDGVYLDLHGAMVTQSHADGEGELLRRIREVVGPDMPVVISLDLHANVTAGMVRHASAMTMFRTYPHLDMAATGARAFPVLRHLVQGGQVFAAHRPLPYLLPLVAQHTWSPPMQGLYARAIAVGPAPHAWAEIAAGFTAADIAEMGPSVLAYGPSQAQADATADALYAACLEAEAEFDGGLLDPDEAVAEAMRRSAGAEAPVILADVQDNAGAGASSDTTGLLCALVEGGAQGAILGMLCDAEMAARAHAGGVGAVLDGALGGRAGTDPYEGRFVVEALSDGRFAFTGEMYAGCVAEIGPCAVLRVDDPRCDLRVVVTTLRCQCLDLACFTHLGLDPSSARLVAVKSTVHYRADFEPIASGIVNVAAPGLFPCRLETIPYERLRKGVRITPMGPVR